MSILCDLRLEFQGHSFLLRNESSDSSVLCLEIPNLIAGLSLGRQLASVSPAVRGRLRDLPTTLERLGLRVKVQLGGRTLAALGQGTGGLDSLLRFLGSHT